MAADGLLPVLRTAVAMQWRAARWSTAGQLLTITVVGTAPVVSAWLLRSVLDSLAAGAGRPASLGWLVVGLAAAIGLQAVLPYLGQYLAAQSGRATGQHATSELFGAVSRLKGLRRLEDPAYLDRLSMAQQVGLSGPGQVFASFTGFVQYALTLAGFFTAVLVLNPVMALVVLMASTPAAVIQVSIARRRAAMFAGLSHAQRRQYFYAGLLTNHAAAKEIRLFNLGAFFHGRMLAELRHIQQAEQRTDQREVQAYGLLSALSALVSGVGVWWAVWAAARGRLTVGDVALFLAAMGATSSALAGIVATAGTGYQALLLMRSYTGVLAEGPDLPVPPHPAPAPVLRRGIEFEDVWFRYGPGLPWVLRGVSFSVPRGQAVALVGRNGAGKSTLVKLMCRFYDPERGRIRWDGVDLRDMDPAELRDRISAVFQDYMSYDLSARENIGVGDLRRAGGPEEVVSAARRAGVHDVLSALPRGYDTLLTVSYLDMADREDPQTGVLLSGGQWQRVALARALLREGRDLVLLDEPSSGLDAESEQEVRDVIREHRGASTAVLVSHRLSAVRDADNIVVLAHGEVIEQGSHEALMAGAGVYARLFSLQAEGFTDREAAVDQLVGGGTGG